MSCSPRYQPSKITSSKTCTLYGAKILMIRQVNAILERPTVEKTAQVIRPSVERRDPILPNRYSSTSTLQREISHLRAIINQINIVDSISSLIKVLFYLFSYYFPSQRINMTYATRSDFLEMGIEPSRTSDSACTICCHSLPHVGTQNAV